MDSALIDFNFSTTVTPYVVEVSRQTYAEWHKNVAIKKRDFQVDKSPKTVVSSC